MRCKINTWPIHSHSWAKLELIKDHSGKFQKPVNLREGWEEDLHEWPHPEAPALEHINSWGRLVLLSSRPSSFQTNQDHGSPRFRTAATWAVSVPRNAVYFCHLCKLHWQLRKLHWELRKLHWELRKLHEQLHVHSSKNPGPSRCLWKQHSLHRWVEAILSAFFSKGS